MEELIKWFSDNGAELMIALFALHSAALFVVNATPTPKDNEALAKVYKVIELLGGLVTKKVKK